MSAIEVGASEAAVLAASLETRLINESGDVRVTKAEFLRLVALVRSHPVLTDTIITQNVQLSVLSAAAKQHSDEQSTLRRRKAVGSSSSGSGSSSNSAISPNSFAAPAASSSSSSSSKLPVDASLDRRSSALSLLSTLGGGAQDYATQSMSSSRSAITAVGDDSDLLPTGAARNSNIGKGPPAAKDAKAQDAHETLLKKQNLVLFFKGLAAWALCYIFGYTFDMVSVPRAVPTISDLPPYLVSNLNKGLIASQWLSEVNSSAAFALLMHAMGFSVFLLYFTGQIRWLVVNGVVGLVMMWVFNLTGMEAQWIVFSTHSVGYVLLAVVVIVMVLVFGGVVLVWSNLMEFLTDILARYPEVKDELSENVLLEQVLSRYNKSAGGGSGASSRESSSGNLAGMKKNSGAGRREGRDVTPSPTVMQDVEAQGSHGLASALAARGSNTSLSPAASTGSLALSRTSSLQLHETHDARLLPVLSGRRPDSCFFCLSRPDACLIPACSGWTGQEGRSITTCTPYTELAAQRNDLLRRVDELESLLAGVEDGGK